MAVAKIGPYEILETIQGGLRPLYRARAQDGRILTLKTVAADQTSPEVRERFEREAAICTAMDHPNLVRVYDSGEADGILYQAQESLEGSDLAHIIAEGRALTWEQKMGIMDRVCDGLAYIHSRDITHRDLKPGNIFLENSGRVVILDFGMAHIDSSHLTRAGQSAGTLSYMAPEQLRGGVCTPATDVFAAGVVFFELATGKHPFSSGNNDAPSMMMALLSQAPLDLRKIAPDAPSGLEFVLGQALEKDPKRRVHDGSELKKALESREALAPMLARLMGKSAPAAGISADYRMTVVRPRMVEALAPAAPAAEPVAAAGPAPVAAADPAPVVARAPKPVAARAPTPVKRITHYKQEAAFCPACTQANAKNATICVRCGTPLRDAAVTPASEKSGQPRLPLVILGVLGVLLVIAAIAAFFIGR